MENKISTESSVQNEEVWMANDELSLKNIVDVIKRNQRLIGGKPAPYDSPTIMVGAADSYEARCRACHIVPRATEGQQQLL